MSQAGLVMISGANTAPSLTTIGGQQGPDWQPGYFRTSHNDEGEAQTAATFVFQELGVTKAATINDGDAYTRGLTGVFNQVFTELGGQIVLDAAINKGDTDMKPVLEAVAISQAELVFFPLFEPEGNHITLQAREVQGFENIILMGADAIFVSTFIKAVGSAGEGMYFVGPATPSGAAYEAFVAKYKSKYGEDPLGPFHAHGYDAANMLFEAIIKVAVKGEDGTLHLGRQALRDALYATSGFQGLTGTLSCDKFGDCAAASFKIVRLDDPAAGLEGLTNNVVYTYTPGEQVKSE
jgi:branched-chain amino acid transport system substrate-binding protein